MKIVDYYIPPLPGFYRNNGHSDLEVSDNLIATSMSILGPCTMGALLMTGFDIVLGLNFMNNDFNASTFKTTRRTLDHEATS